MLIVFITICGFLIALWEYVFKPLSLFVYTINSGILSYTANYRSIQDENDKNIYSKSYSLCLWTHEGSYLYECYDNRKTVRYLGAIELNSIHLLPFFFKRYDGYVSEHYILWTPRYITKYIFKCFDKFGFLKATSQTASIGFID